MKLFLTTLAYLLLSAIAFPIMAASDGREEWEKVLRAGKQEGRVVLYTFPGQELVFQEFQKNFPDIKLVEVSVRGSERVTRIVSERRAGKYLADILIGGVGSAQSGLLKTGLLDPIKPGLILPEVLDESKWWQGKHVYGDDEDKYIFSFGGAPLYYFHYNTTLLNPQEFKSYWDFISPKWKGKMVVTEPMTGGTQEPLVFMYHNKELGPEFVRRFLTEMDLGVSRDIRQLLDWVAQGKYAMSALQNADRIRLWDARKQGLPVNAFETDKFKEGGLVGSGARLIKAMLPPPHSNAAKVFINWFLSREGQIAYQKLVQGGRNSLRIDIPKDDLPPHARIKPGAKYTLIDDRRNRMAGETEEVWPSRLLMELNDQTPDRDLHAITFSSRFRLQTAGQSRGRYSRCRRPRQASGIACPLKRSGNMPRAGGRKPSIGGVTK